MIIKKVFTLAIATLSLVACNSAQKKADAEVTETKNTVTKKNDLQEANLKGKVKSVREIDYEAIQEAGQIKKGKVLEGAESEVSNVLTNYNEKGYVVDKEYYNFGYSFKISYKYDAEGSMVEENHYNSDSKLEYQILYEYKYDEKGNVVEQIEKGSESKTNRRITYGYDDKGNLVEEKWYYADGTLSWHVTYRYNDKGYKVEEITNSIEQSPSKITYKYDDKGGNTERDEYFHSGGLVRYKNQYKYDSQGNWIKRIKYVDGTLSIITERTIEYY